MKEFVFVECLFTIAEYSLELNKLLELEDDFIHLGNTDEDICDDSGVFRQYVKVSGKINTMTASVIKMQNPALAGKMRISYISDELKNKYRR